MDIKANLKLPCRSLNSKPPREKEKLPSPPIPPEHAAAASSLLLAATPTHPPRKRSGVETPGWLLDFPFADFSKESGYLRNPLSSA
ncbi:hypothetical protein ACP4OV_029443 [Aristida adscensionis]